MNDTLIGAIQTFTLKARADLEREAHEQLEGLYGWLPDGSFAPVIRYPALALNEARETRTRLEQYLRDEAEAGFDAAKARRKLVREAAFTWLNRFVAFKMLETRHVLKTLLAPPERANAFLLWLADERDPEARGLHDAGDTPVNALGEGPRQTAYRRFLLWQCGELAREMSVLFDPTTLASRLCPRPNALRALTDALNAASLAEAWTAGNEETIGWVYEGFIEDDNAAVFENFSKGKKVLPEEIGAATQRFTPRWIVKFLVENSLGRFWLEMHPDSALEEKLSYFVPPASDPPARPQKPVREILFLDPSCGSMHFGLVAFDLFGEMYREEIDHAGQPGWPAMPSVATEVDIPAAIVAQNLHGIDIDPRAVQISALTLLIKARGLNREAAVTDRNLACCNIEAITGGRLDAIIQGAKFDQPVYERILRAMAARLKDSNNLGSLLRPECDLERLIDEERGKLDRSAGLLPGMGESDLFTLDTPEKREKFFVGLSSEIAQHLDEFVRLSRTAGKDESHFVGEASKGLNFLRLVQQRYDVVATNPPYMSRRNMSNIMARYLDDDYSESKGDLYAAFIARCVELTDPMGQTAMVTQQSFMFISSYENLRKALRANSTIRTMAHLGPKAFPNITGEKVNTTAFVFVKQPDAKRREASVGVYFRLVKERDAEAKRLAFESALAAIRASQPFPQVFTCKQSDFDAIPKNPWIYWIPSEMRALFKELPSIGDFYHTCRGIQTSNNPRFIRFWWEVGTSRICLNPAADLSKKWVPYMKGGPLIRWYGNQEHVLNWANSGAEIYAFRPSSVIRNADLMKSEGVTFSSITSGRIGFRYMPPGFFWDQSGSALIKKNGAIVDDLAILNSIATIALARLVAPTINYTIGDIAIIPFKGTTEKFRSETAMRVEGAIRLAEENSAESESTYNFVRPVTQVKDVFERAARFEELDNQIDKACADFYGLNIEDLEDLEQELAAVVRAEEVDEENNKEEIEVVGDYSPADWARSWISYAFGVVLGRFEIGKTGGLGRGNFPEAVVADIRKLVDNDGTMPCEAGHPQDLAASALACLNLMLGADAAREAIRTAIGEGDSLDALRGWLDRFTGQSAQSFWRYHSQQYRKRPVYWPFQSPDRRYTVWVFHERFGPDTLFRIRNEFVEPRLRLAEREIADLRVRAVKDRKAAKELDRMLDLADDLGKFAANLKAIAERGYTPQIDDGVLLNAAPLHEVLPSWPDTRAAWKELEQGKYEWAHQAMAYWPDRVKVACLTNKSFAIAHGLAVPETAPVTETMKRRGRKKRE
jgi:hypothetical protein